MDGARIAASRRDMQAVWRLTGLVYQQKGYHRMRADDDGHLRHHPHLDEIPQTTVLMVDDDDGLAGTISVTEDGPLRLHVDATFPKEVAAVRRKCSTGGLRLGASWRVITRPDVRSAGRVLFVLIGAAIRNMMTRRLDTVLCSFHPRHESVHRRLLGFRTIGRADHDPTVGGAPAVLMLGNVSAIARKWDQR